MGLCTFPRFVLVAVEFCLVLSACSHLHPGSVDRTFEGRYDRVFQATFEMLRERQFPLKRVDGGAGRIVTGRRPIQVIREMRPVEKVDARVKRGEGRDIKVRLVLVFVDQASDPQRSVRDDGDDQRTDDVLEVAVSRSFDAGAVYDAYLDAIQERVEAFQEGDTP